MQPIRPRSLQTAAAPADLVVEVRSLDTALAHFAPSNTGQKRSSMSLQMHRICQASLARTMQRRGISGATKTKGDSEFVKRRREYEAELREKRMQFQKEIGAAQVQMEEQISASQTSTGGAKEARLARKRYG